MVLRPLASVLFVLAGTLAFSTAWAEPVKLKSMRLKTHHYHSSAACVAPSTRAYAAAMVAMHKNMHSPMAGDADVDFVRGMIPHHQAAVDMANIQLQYGRDERLKEFSRWIIQAQEQEIGFMTQWLRRRDNGAAPNNATNYYGNAMAAMHHGMNIDYTGDADVDFVRGMIPHHQGAVEMARIVIANGNDPEVTRLANEVFRSQNYEIAWMQDWLMANTANKK
jgi:uncharacterized protein (DUF305 family)